MSTNHNPLQLCCILINLAIVVLTTLIAFSSLANQYDFQEAIPGLLRHDLEDVAQKKLSPISPASWIHCAWAVVFVYQILWSFHGFVSIFRRTAGVPVYTSPVLLSIALLLLFDFACGFNVAWFIVYDRMFTGFSCLFIAATCVLAWAAYCVSLYALDSNQYRLEKAERHCEIWVTRIFVQNALALYATWCIIVATLNLTVCLINSTQTNIDEDIASVIGLSIIGFFQVSYLLIDVIFMDKLTRYIVTPYIIPAVVLSACLFRQDNWYSDDINFLLLAALLSFAFFAIMVKSACVACRLMRPNSGGGEIYGKGQLTPEDEEYYLIK